MQDPSFGGRVVIEEVTYDKELAIEPSEQPSASPNPSRSPKSGAVEKAGITLGSQPAASSASSVSHSASTQPVCTKSIFEFTSIG